MALKIEKRKKHNIKAQVAETTGLFVMTFAENSKSEIKIVSKLP